MAEIVVAKRGDLNNGEMKVVRASGREILLARTGDSYHAAESRCPHLGGKLAEGKLEGTIVTCPLHGSQFDLINGKVIRWTNFTGFAARIGKMLKTPRPLVTYRVKVEGDSVLVEI